MRKGVSQLGSNWNNGSNAGAFNRNVNNTPSNRNRNIGTHVLIVRKLKTPRVPHCPASWQNIK